MDEISPNQSDSLNADSLLSGENSVKVRWRLFLGPLIGIIALIAVTISYPPLEGKLIWWVGVGPCMISICTTNIAWRKAKAGDDVRAFFPHITWLAFGCLFVPAILFLNAVLDHSPLEEHRQFVTDRMLTHHKGNVSYGLEVKSWRPNRAHEEFSVSEGLYLALKPGDPVIVETHRGALGIPLLASVHLPN